MWRSLCRQIGCGRGWRQFPKSSLHPQDSINKGYKMYKQIGEKTQETIKVKKAIPVGQNIRLRRICSIDGKFEAHGLHDRIHNRGYSRRAINKGHLGREKTLWDSQMLGHTSGLCSDTMSVTPYTNKKIDFVPATAEDYEELMSISSGIYNGLDYLPFRYHLWLKEPQRRMFVAKCEGKVVGFISFILVDDGSTAVMEGIRVAPWMRRGGVGGLIERFCINTIRSDHPEVRRIRLSRKEDPPKYMLTKYKVINSKAVISVFLPADQLKTTLRLLESRVNNLDRSKNLSVLGPEEILRIFEESKTRDQLFPGGLLVQAHLPLTAHKSNLNLLLNRQIVWIYSHPGDLCGSASSSKDTTGCDGTHAYQEGFLSLGSPPYPVLFTEGAHRLDIDMFGNDPSCAKVHVVEQLKIGVQALPAGSSIICVLCVDESLWAELDQLCEGLTPFYFIRARIIMETEI